MQNTIHQAILDGEDPSCIEGLLNQGIDKDARNSVGSTPLMIAAMLDDVPILKLLLDFGADVESLNDSGWSALHIAAKSNALQTAAVLIAHGATTDVCDARSRTPKYFASSPEMMELMSAAPLVGASEL
ncbi:MAG: ankyrin repeat domain-containing protein [Gemmatimonadota bacterium]|nr:ankyrin repeat domain-containing protein [Gemmatimonadota bacterium]